jgi:Rieske 2Fe-2S family protein
MDLDSGAETMSLDGASRSRPIASLQQDRRRRVYYLGLFPNLLVSLHPDYVLTHRLQPKGPGETFVQCQWLFPSEVASGQCFDPSYATDFWDVTNKEDWGACESVQRGLSSKGYVPGPLSPKEDAVYAFMSSVAASYLAGGWTKAGHVEAGV